MRIERKVQNTIHKSIPNDSGIQSVFFCSAFVGERISPSILFVFFFLLAFAFLLLGTYIISCELWANVLISTMYGVVINDSNSIPKHTFHIIFISIPATENKNHFRKKNFVRIVFVKAMPFYSAQAQREY